MAETSKKKDLIRACYAPDARSAQQMIAVLEQYGIHAEKRGGVRDIYRIGGDVVGEEIMVDPADHPVYYSDTDPRPVLTR